MTALKVDSKDPMEVTLTKTSLGILQNLGQVSAVYVISILRYLTTFNIFHIVSLPTIA